MPPPLAGPADATAPPDIPDTPDSGTGGGGPGAVPSGGPGAPIPDQGQGMLPPSTAAPPGAGVPPTGNQALGDQLMSNIVGAMHYARMFYPPGSEKEKAISHHFKGLSKLFMPDSGTMKGGTMPPVAQVARGPGSPGGPMAGPRVGGPPPLGGMGGAAGGPPSPPRGPMAMPPAGVGP